MDNSEHNQVSEVVEATPAVASDQPEPTHAPKPKRRKATRSETTTQPSSPFPFGIRVIDN